MFNKTLSISRQATSCCYGDKFLNWAATCSPYISDSSLSFEFSVLSLSIWERISVSTLSMAVPCFFLFFLGEEPDLDGGGRGTEDCPEGGTEDGFD